MALEPRAGHRQRLPPTDPALGLRGAGAPPRRPRVPRLPASGDHRPARHDRHLRRAADRAGAPRRQAACDRRHRRAGAARSSARFNDPPSTGCRAGGQRGLNRARHGALLRRAGGGRRDRWVHASCGRRRSRGCSRSRSTAKRTAPSTFRSAAGLGFELGGLADQRRLWPGATSTARTFWHGGFGSSDLLGRPRPRPGDGLPHQRRAPRRSRSHSPPRPLRRRPGGLPVRRKSRLENASVRSASTSRARPPHPDGPSPASRLAPTRPPRSLPVWARMPSPRSGASR